MVVADAPVAQLNIGIDRRRLMPEGLLVVLTSVDVINRIGRRLGMNGAVVSDAAVMKFGARHGFEVSKRGIVTCDRQVPLRVKERCFASRWLLPSGLAP